MTRKRRMTKPAPAPVATSALGPPAHSPARSARSTRSAASSVLSLLTPPTRAKSSSSSSSSAFADLPVLSPPLKKRVHTRSDARAVKVQSLEEALDEQDEYDDQQRFVDGDGYGDSQSNTSNSNTQRHNIKPDPHLPDPYKRAAKVLHYKGSVYDAMLTRARVHQNQCEFIALQALEYENQFYLWTRSGSIGYTGKTLLMGPYECEERIIVEFCMVFSSKTSCTWEERHSLQYQEGSFTWIELDYSMGTPYADLSSSLLDSGDDYEDPGSSSRAGQKRRRNSRSSSSSSSSSSSRQYNFVQDWNNSSSSNAATLPASKRAATAAALWPPASRLHAEVQSFLNLIADPHEYHSYNYSETEEVMEEAQKMPLGRLSKTTIKRGYETLQQIYEALRTRTACRTRILNLSSHFYSIIPHHSRLDVIDTMVKLGKKVAMMESVCENVRGMSAMEVVNACKQRNYLDECYALLGCDMLPISENSDEFAFVKAYLKNSSCCGWKDGTLQLLNVFRVYKPDEDDRFEPYRDFPNRRILWHGSRMSNWLGILTDGLRIAPPEVASNGRIFGKGIYFTDKASKAQAYCHASARHGGSQNKCVFVLSEVALGDVKEMVSSDENAKRWVHVSCGGHTKASAFNSCKGVGTCRPDASGDVVDKDGAVWPLGKPVQTAEATGLSHSEYIIYNPAQARMRYVVVAKSAY